MIPPTAGIFLAIFAGAAAAAEPKVMTGLDFMVDWPKLVGETVTITDGRITTASDQFAFLRMSGGKAWLRPPWSDREDLRYVFAHCTSMLTDSACVMPVTGTVRGEGIGGSPELTGVDFQVPTQ